MTCLNNQHYPVPEPVNALTVDDRLHWADETPCHTFWPLGTLVQPYGKIGSIGSLKGERYYWMEDQYGSIAMMPAVTVEAR